MTDRTPEDPGEGVRIPLDQLSSGALQAVVEEFVTRDGTELTDGERKTKQVMAMLESGEAEVWFDPSSRTCNILMAP